MPAPAIPSPLGIPFTRNIITTSQDMNQSMNTETAAEGSMKAERGSTISSNPDAFHPSSDNAQGYTALYSPSSNDVCPLFNRSNSRQSHPHSHTDTMDSSATPLTESNLEEHSRQMLLLLEDPDYKIRVEQERRDNMAAALQSLQHGRCAAKSPTWPLRCKVSNMATFPTGSSQTWRREIDSY